MATMKKTENKATLRFLIAFSVIFSAIGLMVYANLFDTYLFDYFKAGLARENLVQPGIGRALLKLTHYLGALCFGGSIYWLWKMKDYPLGERSGWVYFAVSLALVVLGILLSAGFNFDLHGIE